MGSEKAKGKKNLLLKTWDRCRSILCEKSKNYEFSTKSKIQNHVAPEGCFWVYVGPEKQRFVIKTKYANHPLFRMLLEDAVEEYGYNSEGPLLLPCDVKLFYEVLAVMAGRRSSSSKEEEIVLTWGFAYGSYGYGLLTRSILLKMNQS